MSRETAPTMRWEYGDTVAGRLTWPGIDPLYPAFDGDAWKGPFGYPDVRY